MADVSVLIPVRNEIRWIAACLDQVFAQSVPPREVIVIDSGSTDGTLDVLRRYPVRIVQIPAAEFHHARTRNLAGQLAGGEILVYLAGDAIPAGREWLARLVAPLANPEVAASYGRHHPKPGARLERMTTLRTVYGPRALRKNVRDSAELGYLMYHFSTVNCAIRRDIWERYPFPEDLIVFEDVGFAKLAMDDGWTIAYEPDAAVFHSHDYPVGKLFRRSYDTGAIYQRLNIWRTAAQTRSVWQDGLGLLRAKLRALCSSSFAAASADIGRDAVKFCGLWLGRHERWLPLALRRRLSCFGIDAAAASHPSRPANGQFTSPRVELDAGGVQVEGSDRRSEGSTL